MAFLYSLVTMQTYLRVPWALGGRFASGLDLTFEGFTPQPFTLL